MKQHIPLRPQAGIALILTIWLLTVLTAVVAEFMFSTRLKAAAERNSRDGLRAYALAMAGYYSALEALGPEVKYLSLEEDGQLLLHHSPEEEGVPALKTDVTLGRGTFSYTIADEDGRININKVNRAVLSALLEKVGLEPGVERDTVVDSVFDWRDRNREHRLNGAEEDYYRALETPYSCKDKPLDVPEELLLVRGMQKEYFSGGEVGGKTYLPLRDYITVYPVSLNVNTAPPEVLEIRRRQRSRSPTPVSRYFTITASGRGREKGPERIIRAVVLRQEQSGEITFKLLYWNDNYFLNEV